MSTVLLVRHPPVPRAWAGRCYGQSDMGWSRNGQAIAGELVNRLVAEGLSAIIHSDMIRTRRLAEAVGRRTGISPQADARWRERDFGSWEGRTWQAIWRETGDLMDRMLTDPDEFRPGGGETTTALIARAQSAWADLAGTAGTILVVAHGGPIAAVRSALSSTPPRSLIELVPDLGEIVRLTR